MSFVFSVHVLLDLTERKQAQIDESNSFVTYQHYDDVITFKIVGAVSEVLGLDTSVVLEVFGEYFMEYVIRLGYGNLLRTLGHDLKSFLEGLDFLHFVYLKMTFKEMDAPSFRCSETEDGTLLLHYYSNRKGLEPIVVGVVKAAARIFFDIEVVLDVWGNREPPEGRKSYTMISIKAVNEKISQGSGDKKALTEKPHSRANVYSQIRLNMKDTNEQLPEKLWMDQQSFCQAFPYHVVFDEKLRVKQCGMMITRICRGIRLSDTFLDNLFELVHPPIPLTADAIRQFINMDFMLTFRQKLLSGGFHGKTVLTLRGQMQWMESLQCLIFLSSPRLTNLEDMQERGLKFSDMAAHDVTRDLVLFNQQRTVELEIAKQLEQKKEELRYAIKELGEEKKKTDMLLYSMLPRQVADQLREGKEVEAGYYDEVTILFSDIVTFTNICGQCKPIDVVHLLNNMYRRFDLLTNIHDVYKVETIGDAYMVVGGLPVRTHTHAERIANFSIGMVAAAAEVKSPIDGSPIKIRVGMHSGPVVAGVVGLKMPRYCLFGDTVNTASRMESHGVPEKIHISPSTYEKLKDKSFLLERRGEMEIKGKGKMTTYFIIKNKKVSIEQIMGRDSSNSNHSDE
ncbi:guanylate cyclase soluble subunit beta-2-like, partial [Glandiceps talaboti]